MYGYCREKKDVNHFWELKGQRNLTNTSSYPNIAHEEPGLKVMNQAVTFSFAEIHRVNIIYLENLLKWKEDLPAKLQGRKVRSWLALQIPGQSRNQKS